MGLFFTGHRLLRDGLRSWFASGATAIVHWLWCRSGPTFAPDMSRILGRQAGLRGQWSHTAQVLRLTGHAHLPFARLAASVLVLCFAATACSREEVAATPDDAPELATLPASALTELQRAEIEQLQALGYLDGDVPAPDESGVTRHDVARAWAGYNLYTSEHAPYVFLLDMNGKLLHRWEVTLPESDGVMKLRRVHLYPDGRLLVLIERQGLVLLDRDGQVLWHKPCSCHHDFALAEDGSIYVLTRRTAIYPARHPSEPIRNDFITQLNAEGEVIREVSLLAAFEASECCSSYLENGMHGDVFHSNTLELLDGRLEHLHPAFRSGNVLTSWRELDAIGIVDMEEGEVVWGSKGYFQAQHHPSVLESGNMLLFDNVDTTKSFDASRVIEFDPFSETIHWSFESSADFPFYSRTGGASVRLPNGNTLITETRGGRVLEVAPDGSVVWIYVNPARVQKASNMIARIFEMQRLPADTEMSWLPNRSYLPDALTGSPLELSVSP